MSNPEHSSNPFTSDYDATEEMERLIRGGKAATYHQAHQIIMGRPPLSASVPDRASPASDGSTSETEPVE
jgi:hypothetical protein